MRADGRVGAPSVWPATATRAPAPANAAAIADADRAAAARDEGDAAVEAEDVELAHRGSFAV